MNFSFISSMPNYRIAIECLQKQNVITLAGFTASENTENMLCKHLTNLCMQSNGSFFSVQQLLLKLMNQWQQSFSLQSTQVLKSMQMHEETFVSSVYLYKQTNDKEEKLVNKISF